MMTISEERNEARKVAALERIAGALEVITRCFIVDDAVGKTVVDMEKGGAA